MIKTLGNQLLPLADMTMSLLFSNEREVDQNFMVGDYKPTMHQKIALRKKFDQNNSGHPNFYSFASSSQVMYGSTLVVKWQKIYLCIEPDGHCHS